MYAGKGSSRVRVPSPFMCLSIVIVHYFRFYLHLSTCPWSESDPCSSPDGRLLLRVWTRVSSSSPTDQFFLTLTSVPLSFISRVGVVSGSIYSLFIGLFILINVVKSRRPRISHRTLTTLYFYVSTPPGPSTSRNIGYVCTVSPGSLFGTFCG